jgi:hypothetical protein
MEIQKKQDVQFSALYLNEDEQYSKDLLDYIFHLYSIDHSKDFISINEKEFIQFCINTLKRDSSIFFDEMNYPITHKINDHLTKFECALVKIHEKTVGLYKNYKKNENQNFTNITSTNLLDGLNIKLSKFETQYEFKVSSLYDQFYGLGEVEYFEQEKIEYIFNRK